MPPRKPPRPVLERNPSSGAAHARRKGHVALNMAVHPKLKAAVVRAAGASSERFVQRWLVARLMELTGLTEKDLENSVEKAE